MNEFLKSVLATVVGIFVFPMIMGLFLLIGIIGFALGGSSSDKPKINKNSVLVVNLTGMISEQSGEDILGQLTGNFANSTGMDELLLAIKNAKESDKVKGIYLEGGQVFLAVLLLAGTLGIDTSSLLAILSVAGLAVSLSIQDTLSNLAGAVVLLTTRPFKLGDFIEVSGKSGTVQKIGVFYTQIATPDNQLVHLPNSQVAAAQITTVTGSETRRLEITVQVSPDTDIERVKAALTRAGEHPKRDQAQPIFARLSAYADGRACYTLRLWVATADYWDVYYDVLEAIGRSFAEARIEMTYPHINVHMGS